MLLLQSKPSPSLTWTVTWASYLGCLPQGFALTTHSPTATREFSLKADLTTATLFRILQWVTTDFRINPGYWELQGLVSVLSSHLRVQQQPFPQVHVLAILVNSQNPIFSLKFGLFYTLFSLAKTCSCPSPFTWIPHLSHASVGATSSPHPQAGLPSPVLP